MLKLIFGKLRKNSYELTELNDLVNEVVGFVTKKNNISVIHCFVNNNENKDSYWTDIKVVYSDCEFEYFTSSIWRNTFEEASQDCKQIVKMLKEKGLSEIILDDSDSTEYLY